jgi:pimeloyl-ACP methyl ester carboxylesterase
MNNMMHRSRQTIRWKAGILLLLAQGLGTSSVVRAQANSMPPIVADFEAKVISESKMAGRKVVRFEHEMIKEWGYAPGAPSRPFIVVEPATPLAPLTKGGTGGAAPPLLVYLHSAGNEFQPSIPTNLPGFGPEFITLALHSVGGQQDGWHGWHKIKEDPKKFVRTYTPVEHRLLATIEWVARKYKVDRNRIYLWGISMGGSGTLGLGLARGDIFAAAYVVVPAGIEHGWHRMGFPEITKGKIARPDDYLARMSGVGLPDPPPLVNFSSQTDGWARGQENLVQAMHDGRHLMIYSWAPIGHTANWDATNPTIVKYPWLSIRKDQAYPAFTDASTDQKYPGFQGKDPDQAGQLNAYFRWKTKTDEPTRFEMDLSLVDAKELSTAAKPFAVPEKSVTDVTPRRLQKFKVQAGKAYTWRLLDASNIVQSGEVRPDSVGLLTLPRLTITAVPRTLVLEAK